MRGKYVDHLHHIGWLTPSDKLFYQLYKLYYNKKRSSSEGVSQHPFTHNEKQYNIALSKGSLICHGKLMLCPFHPSPYPYLTLNTLTPPPPAGAMISSVLHHLHYDHDAQQAMSDFEMSVRVPKLSTQHVSQHVAIMVKICVG